MTQIQIQTIAQQFGITALCDFIEASHHSYLNQALPELRQLAARVNDRHGDKGANLRALCLLTESVAVELADHLLKEERVLFPHCRAMDAAGGPVPFHCGTVHSPIAVMHADHFDTVESLAKMRQLSNGFVAPDWACPTYRRFLHGLEVFESDSIEHIRKENELLFPLVLELQERS
jgi:regulator of cell morphogenesis and NO signaling